MVMATVPVDMAVFHFFLAGGTYADDGGLEQYPLAGPWMVAVDHHLAVIDIGDGVKDDVAGLVLAFELHADFQVLGRERGQRFDLYQLFVVIAEGIGWFEADLDRVADGFAVQQRIGS